VPAVASAAELSTDGVVTAGSASGVPSDVDGLAGAPSLDTRPGGAGGCSRSDLSLGAGVPLDRCGSFERVVDFFAEARNVIHLLREPVGIAADGPDFLPNIGDVVWSAVPSCAMSSLVDMCLTT
jgi:hypothetical protein